MCSGSFTLADSDSDSDTDFKKYYCQQASVTVDTSKQFYVSHLLLGLGVGHGSRQCKHTIKAILLDDNLSIRCFWCRTYLIACIN